MRTPTTKLGHSADTQNDYLELVSRAHQPTIRVYAWLLGVVLLVPLMHFTGRGTCREFLLQCTYSVQHGEDKFVRARTSRQQLDSAMMIFGMCVNIMCLMNGEALLRV